MTLTSLIRTIRTPSSERYVLQRGGEDAGALDLHYLPQGAVQATIVLFEHSGIPESEVPQLLTYVDQALLPDVSLDQRNLTFTVVIGHVLGAYTAAQDQGEAPVGE